MKGITDVHYDETLVVIGDVDGSSAFHDRTCIVRGVDACHELRRKGGFHEDYLDPRLTVSRTPGCEPGRTLAREKATA